MLNMLSKIFKAPLLTAGLASLLGIAGCGHHAPALPPQPPSAKSLISDMRSSFAITQSVRIIGHVGSGRNSGTVDLSLFRSGAMKGTVETNGLRLELLRIGGRAYVYLNKKHFMSYRRIRGFPVMACAVACGKYLLVNSRILSNFSLKFLSRLIDNSAPKARELTGKTDRKRKTGKKAPVPRVTLTRFAGQPAWQLTAGKFEIFVAKQSGYLLEMSKSKVGTFTFSEWNAVPPIRAPRPNQVYVFG